jgi:autotransporter-like protein
MTSADLRLAFERQSRAQMLKPVTGTDQTVDLSNVSVTVAYDPSPTGNFFVKGGAGLSLVDTEVNVKGSKVSADLGKGFGVLVGGGYDFPFGRHFSLTPAVDFWYGRVGDLKFAGEPIASDWKQNVIDFTVGITFR